MPFGNELGFEPRGNYSLDYWGSRRRGEWPGPKLDHSKTNWVFPEDYPLQHQKLLNKRYWRSLSRIRNEIRPMLPEDQLSRIVAEGEISRHQDTMFTAGFPLCKEWIEEPIRNIDNPDFCWKLCAIYVASVEDETTKQLYGGFLYEYLDSIFFQGEQTWVFCEHFLAKAIHCSPEQARDLPYLIDAHKQICNRVSNWCPGCEPLSAEECREKDVLCTEWRPEDHLLLPIFQRLLVIVDEIPTSGRYDNPDFAKAKGRMVFIQDENTADPVNVPDLCTKYSVYPTDDPNVVMGELDALVQVVMSSWEQEKTQISYLGSIVGKLQERVKFKVQDREIERQRAICEMNSSA